MFEFAVEYAPPSSNTSIDFSNRHARAVRDEPAPSRLDQSGERRAKQRRFVGRQRERVRASRDGSGVLAVMRRLASMSLTATLLHLSSVCVRSRCPLRLLLESGPAAHVHELGDLGSVLQLDKLRQLSSAYAQAMHACHSGADSHAAAAAAAASPTAAAAAAASAAAAAGSSYGTAVNIATAAAPPGSSSVGTATAAPSAILPPASLRLLHRVETAVEDQRVLREQLLRGQPPPPLMPAVSAVPRARGSVAGAAADSLLSSLSPAVFAQLQQQMRSSAPPSTPTAPSSAMSRSATGSAPPPPPPVAAAALPMHFSLQAIHAAAAAATLALDPAAHRP